MTEKFRSIKVPLFIKIDQDLRINKILQDYHIDFKNSLIVTTENTKNRIDEKLLEKIEASFYFINENSILESNKLATEIKKDNYDLLICIGGGRVLDIGKHAATKTNLN